jgi:hypothetical protein
LPPNARTLLHPQLAKADTRSEQQLETSVRAASNDGDAMRSQLAGESLRPIGSGGASMAIGHTCNGLLFSY